MEIAVTDGECCPVCGKHFPDEPQHWRVLGLSVVCTECHKKIEEFGRLTNGLHEDNNIRQTPTAAVGRLDGVVGT